MYTNGKGQAELGDREKNEIEETILGLCASFGVDPNDPVGERVAHHIQCDLQDFLADQISESLRAVQRGSLQMTDVLRQDTLDRVQAYHANRAGTPSPEVLVKTALLKTWEGGIA